MSDFFEAKYQRPVFSPVIKITKSNNKPAFVSDIKIDNGESGESMFDKAERVKELMKAKNLSLAKAALLLGFDTKQVANKLRLLEFGDDERKALLENEYSEKEALLFLQLDKRTRLYAMEYCRQENFNEKQIEHYISGAVEQSKGKKRRTFEINNIGFFENSLKKTLELGEKMGFESDLERLDDGEYYVFNIKVSKKCNGE